MVAKKRPPRRGSKDKKVPDLATPEFRAMLRDARALYQDDTSKASTDAPPAEGMPIETVRRRLTELGASGKASSSNGPLVELKKDVRSVTFEFDDLPRELVFELSEILGHHFGAPHKACGR